MEEIDDTMGKGKLIDEIFGEFCEGSYIQPTFITDYPVEMSPQLCIRDRNNGKREVLEQILHRFRTGIPFTLPLQLSLIHIYLTLLCKQTILRPKPVSYLPPSLLYWWSERKKN